jgi:hypothetical protein
MTYRPAPAPAAENSSAPTGFVTYAIDPTAVDRLKNLSVA